MPRGLMVDVWLQAMWGSVGRIAGAAHKPVGKPIFWGPLLWHSGELEGVEGRGGVGLGRKKKAATVVLLSVPVVGVLV